MINLVMSTDDNYAQHAAVAIASILNNAEEPQNIQIFILDSGISGEKKQKIENTVARLNAKIDFVTMDATMINKGFVSGHLSGAAYSRLFLTELLPQNITKVIYLDVDLLVLDDINKLWNLDLQNKPVGAVADLGLISSGRMQTQKKKSIDVDIIKEGYFNSGVLSIDLNQWRSNEYGSKLLDLISNNAFRHHDQDALNKLFKNNWFEIPQRWNVIPPVYYLFSKIVLNSKLRKIALEARQNIGILHFAGRTKPWEFVLTEGYNELYYKYLSLTDFRDEVMPKPSNDMKGKSATRQVWRGRIAALLTK